MFRVRCLRLNSPLIPHSGLGNILPSWHSLLIARRHEQETDITSPSREIRDMPSWLSTQSPKPSYDKFHEAFKVVPGHKEGTDRSMLYLGRMMSLAPIQGFNSVLMQDSITSPRQLCSSDLRWSPSTITYLSPYPTDQHRRVIFSRWWHKRAAPKRTMNSLDSLLSNDNTSRSV